MSRFAPEISRSFSGCPSGSSESCTTGIPKMFDTLIAPSSPSKQRSCIAARTPPNAPTYAQSIIINITASTGLWERRARPPPWSHAYAGKKWKISEIAATKCHIVRIKCTKFDFRWCSAQTPLPHWGRLQRSPKPVSCI